MIDLDDFMPQILPKAPGCPVPAANIALLQAASEFCTRTRTWKDTTTIPVNDLDDILFDPPDQSVVLDFESVLFNDIKLEAKTTAWMDQCMRGWRRGNITGYPRFYTQMNHGTLRVAPIENGLLTVNVLLKPSMDADQLPDYLFNEFSEVIAWGALGRLLSTPDQPFTDFNTGAAYLAAFDQKLAGLAYQGTTGQQRARPRVRGSYI